MPWKQTVPNTLPGVGMGQVPNCVYSPVTRAPFIHPWMTTPRIVAMTGLVVSFLRDEVVCDERVPAAVESVECLPQPEAGLGCGVVSDDPPGIDAGADIAADYPGHGDPGQRRWVRGEASDPLREGDIGRTFDDHGRRRPGPLRRPV